MGKENGRDLSMDRLMMLVWCNCIAGKIVYL